MLVRGIAGRRRLRQVAGLATAALLVVAGCAASSASNSPSPSVAPTTYSGNGQWTGLQWRDITATAGDFFSHRAPPPERAIYGQGGDEETVLWRGGIALVGGEDRSVWISKDGSTWRHAEGSPPGAGIVAWNGMLVVGGWDSSTMPGLWTSADAATWNRVAIQFYSVGCSLGVCDGLAAGPKGILAVGTEGAGHVNDSLAPAVFYFSADGSTWTRSEPPQDAFGVKVRSFFDGFLAYGFVPQSPDHPFDLIGRTWRSSDGRHWSAYEPAVPAPLTGLGPWDATKPWALQFGPAGEDNGEVRSADGLKWTIDTEFVAGAQMLSDGARIVAAQTWLARFYLSEGDGHWRELEAGRRHRAAARGWSRLPAGERPVVGRRRTRLLRRGAVGSSARRIARAVDPVAHALARAELTAPPQFEPTRTRHAPVLRSAPSRR